jgi:hypothetical protein
VLKEELVNEFSVGTLHGENYDLKIIGSSTPWKDERFKAKIEELITKFIPARWRRAHSGVTPYFRINISPRIKTQ